MTPEALLALQLQSARVTIPSIQTYIEDILSPREEVAVNGVCDSALIKRSLVDRLIAHPQFHKFGFIQGLGTKDNPNVYNRIGERVYVLWRLKEWNALTINKAIKLKRWDLEHTKRRKEDERVENAIKNYVQIFFNPQRTGMRVNLKMVGIQILTWIEYAGESEEYRKNLDKIGYYIDRETTLKEIAAMEEELTKYIAEQRRITDERQA